MSELSDALDATRAFLVRFVVFASPAQADAVALWVGHTYTYKTFDTTPYLAIQSPVRESGKTRVLEAVAPIVRAPLRTANASIAALFRIIQDEHPTLLFDEADAIFSRRRSDNTEDMRGLLNSGYRRGTPYLRVVGEGKRMKTVRFDTYCPKALAGIGRLPDTIQDRSIVITLKRKMRAETVGRLRLHAAELDAVPLKEWWEALADVALPEEPAIPDALGDRAADSWEPLLALAEAAGGAWPARAKAAAVALSAPAEPDEESLGIHLMADIRAAFAESGAERLATGSLLERLKEIEESPWREYGERGGGLNAHGLSRLLLPFGIRPGQMKIDTKNVRGYELAAFADAWERYLAPSPHTPLDRYSATPERDSEREGSGVALSGPYPGEGEGMDAGTNPPADDAHGYAALDAFAEEQRHPARASDPALPPNGEAVTEEHAGQHGDCAECHRHHHRPTVFCLRCPKARGPEPSAPIEPKVGMP